VYTLPVKEALAFLPQIPETIHGHNYYRIKRLVALHHSSHSSTTCNVYDKKVTSYGCHSCTIHVQDWPKGWPLLLHSDHPKKAVEE